MHTRLPKAIRLSAAMRMLNADDNSLSLKLIRFYNIAVYRTNSPLSDKPTDDIDCIYISDFTAPWVFRSSQDAALGSKNYCCNYDEILQILATNQKLWGALGVEDTQEEIKQMRSGLLKLKPDTPARVSTNRPLVTKEAIMALAPTLIKMRDKGVSIAKLLDFLATQGLVTQPGTLNRYLNSYQKAAMPQIPSVPKSTMQIISTPTTA